MQQKRRILLVDDEPALLEALEESLRREPYVVQAATSAALALQILAASRVDVVVSDERMPGMIGSEFLAVVCRRHSEVMRILLTGQASLEAAVRAINEGEVFRILLKPCAPDQLRTVLRAAVETKALREKTTRLLREARRRGRLLSDFQRAHPSLSALERDPEGRILVDEAHGVLDPAELLREIELELNVRSEAA